MEGRSVNLCISETAGQRINSFSEPGIYDAALTIPFLYEVSNLLADQPSTRDTR